MNDIAFDPGDYSPARRCSSSELPDQSRRNDDIAAVHQPRGIGYRTGRERNRTQTE